MPVRLAVARLTWHDLQRCGGGDSTCLMSSSSGAANVFFVACLANSSNSDPSRPPAGRCRPRDLSFCIVWCAEQRASAESRPSKLVEAGGDVFGKTGSMLINPW